MANIPAIISPPDQARQLGSQTYVSGTAEPYYGVEIWEVDAGVKPLAVATADGNGNWTTSTPIDLPLEKNIWFYITARSHNYSYPGYSEWSKVHMLHPR